MTRRSRGRGFRSHRSRDDGGYPFGEIPSLKHWWRADLDCTVTGTGVSSWLCQVTGVDLVQAIDAARPPLSSSVAELNGKPAVQFRNTASQELTASNAASEWRFLHDGTGMEVVVPFVARSTSGALRALWGTCTVNDTTGPGATASWFDTAPDDYHILRICHGAGNTVDSQPAFTAGTLRDTYRVSNVSMGSAESPQWRNFLGATSLATGSVGTLNTGDPSGPFRLGASTLPAGGPDLFAQADVPEVFIFDGVMTAGKRTTLLAYLDTRYTP